MAAAIVHEPCDADADAEVVVVGGGIAGLSAAWRLRHREVLLLEAGDRVGGRLRSDPRGDYWLNFGAHLFPAPGSVVDTMAREFDLETVPVTGSMMGLAVDDTKLDRGRIETYPLRLPLSARERWAFAMAGLKVQRGVGRYHRLATRAAGETAADVRARVLAFEDDRWFAEFLGPLPPAVGEIFACAARRATAELTELSAGCGLGLFALVWARQGIADRAQPARGDRAAAEALGRALGDRVRTRCPGSRSSAPRASMCWVRYDHAEGSRESAPGKWHGCPGPARRCAGGARRTALSPRRWRS